jgi:1-deoxy-D-xylulose-5-phosphate reductoisomerase
LPSIARLDFETPDEARFPALKLARDALEAGGAAPIVLNAANEVAVARFLAGAIGFTDIARLVGDALQESKDRAPQSIEEVFEIDGLTRRRLDAVMQAA